MGRNKESKPVKAKTIKKQVAQQQQKQQQTEMQKYVAFLKTLDVITLKARKSDAHDTFAQYQDICKRISEDVKLIVMVINEKLQAEAEAEAKKVVKEAPKGSKK